MKVLMHKETAKLFVCVYHSIFGDWGYLEYKNDHIRCWPLDNLEYLGENNGIN